MSDRARNLGLLALLMACSGCGGTSNSLPSNANTAEYAKQSNDEMNRMYGAPKPDTSAPTNASDMMKNMYNK
jgi:hypothetical protein